MIENFSLTQHITSQAIKSLSSFFIPVEQRSNSRMVSALVVLPGVEIIRRLIQELRDQSFTLQQVHGTTVAAGSAASSQVTSEQPGVVSFDILPMESRATKYINLPTQYTVCFIWKLN
ncbi:hypothetical protein Bca101_046886 [Brassica carinata]